MEFGYKMRLLRKTKGYRLREFAEIVGKSAPYISNIERGVVPPPSAELVKLIAEELDGNVEELLQMANRFDVDAIENIRKNAGKLDSAEKTIKFLNSAINLEDDDPLGGLSGILEILAGEWILNQDFRNKSFQAARFIMGLISKPDEGNNKLGIQLRRELAHGILGVVSDIAHPFPNDNPEEKLSAEEIILGIFKKYPRDLLEEVIKRDHLKAAYHYLLETESEESDEEN